MIAQARQRDCAGREIIHVKGTFNMVNDAQKLARMSEPNLEFGEKTALESELMFKAITGKLDMSSAAPEDTKQFTKKPRPPGVLVTTEDLVSIRAYQDIALTLPTENANISVYLGFEGKAPAGLSVDDFAFTFKKIRAHGQSWAPLEREIFNTSTHLHAFGGEMKVYCASMIQLHEQIIANRGTQGPWKSVTRLKDLLDSNEPIPKEDFPGLKFDANDKADHAEFPDILKEISEAIRKLVDHTNELDRRLTAFSDVLKDDIKREVDLKVKAIEHAKHKIGASTLKDEIASLKLEIEEKTQAYQKAITDAVKGASAAISSAATSNIAGAVDGLAMCIYVGFEVHELRTQRNELCEEYKNKRLQLAVETGNHDALLDIEIKLLRLQTVVIDASAGAKNLVKLWSSLKVYANQSVDRLGQIDDLQSLNKFMRTFRLVAAPWLDIEVLTAQLNKVFIDADVYRGQAGART